ncbi:hypothetical protein WMF45_42380 [Sorangium sp. So ce448]|uniref:hypothetical protein n=1 Tax=Sorangium sp. So ce448 TaxID=3133314 RepID=UPI003F60E0C2
MRVRLILENGGHTLSKVVELPEAPATGSTVQVDRERRVVSVELDAERGQADVYLSEDAKDLMWQIVPTFKLAFVERMRLDGWVAEDEEALCEWLTLRLNRQATEEPDDPS